MPLRPRWRVLCLLLWTGAFAGTPQFTIEQILSAPFASGIVVAPNGRDFAWVSNAVGRRNVWLASAAARQNGALYRSRSLTIERTTASISWTSLSFRIMSSCSTCAAAILNFPTSRRPNPAELTAGVEQESLPRRISRRRAGETGRGARDRWCPPAAIASSTCITAMYLPWSRARERRRGSCSRPAAQPIRCASHPDGRKLAFVSTRTDHSFVGVYTFADKSLEWIDASLSFDLEPRWSPDGNAHRVSAHTFHSR